MIDGAAAISLVFGKNFSFIFANVVVLSDPLAGIQSEAGNPGMSKQSALWNITLNLCIGASSSHDVRLASPYWIQHFVGTTRFAQVGIALPTKSETITLVAVPANASRALT